MPISMQNIDIGAFLGNYVKGKREVIKFLAGRNYRRYERNHGKSIDGFGTVSADFG